PRVRLPQRGRPRPGRNPEAGDHDRAAAGDPHAAAGALPLPGLGHAQERGGGAGPQRGRGLQGLHRRLMPRRVSLALLLCASAAALVARGAEPPPLESALQRVLEEQQRTLHIPGLAFVAVKGDAVIALRGLGLRDIEHALPGTDDPLFPIGSCTKAFTALAAAAGQDDGVLTLDDRPHRYLPSFKTADAEADARGTPRDL